MVIFTVLIPLVIRNKAWLPTITVTHKHIVLKLEPNNTSTIKHSPLKRRQKLSLFAGNITVY